MTYQDILFYFYSRIHLVDIADIFLFACFLYYFLKYLTARPQRPILFFSVSIGLAYVLSKFFSLVLVRTLLDSLVTALLILIAIVFQRDIRRFIEQMSSKFSRLKNKKKNYAKPIKLIVKIVSILAQKRIGSILVLVGHSPVTNIVTGGKRLSTKLDADIIESIFDSRTPAHDGAMLIEDGEVTHIGCQLPLSKGPQKPLNLGTRHSAILGLSERCDSFSVVTSEERGTISIAQNGLLLYDINKDDLEEKLSVFFKNKNRDTRPSIEWFGIFTRNILLKVSSVFIALTLWSAKVYDPGISQASLIFPVEVRNLRSGYKIEKISGEKVTIRLSGPSNSINELKKSPRKVILNYKHDKKRTKLFLSKHYKYDIPDNIKIHKVIPSSISVSTSRVEKEP